MKDALNIYFIHEDAIGEACSTNKIDEKVHTEFWLENLMGRNHTEDLGEDGEIILEIILGNRVGRCGVDVSGSG
jgi:hypothetical protein